jgi:hypothetical protein
MSSVFIASQSGCIFLCSREKFRLVEKRRNICLAVRKLVVKFKAKLFDKELRSLIKYR